MATYQYNLRQIHLNMFGIPILAGGGTDELISIDMPQRFDSRDGVHGDSVGFRTANVTATFSLSILYTSEYNERLITQVNTALNDPLLNGQGVFGLKDIKTGLTIGGFVMLDGEPRQISYGADVSNNVYSGRILGVKVTHAERAAL